MEDRMVIRQAVENDVAELCAILNDIIEIGGTTAYETKLSDAQFHEHFLNGSSCIACLVALDTTMCLGFQALSIRSDLPDGWLDIATFARTDNKVKGVGTALFQKTKLQFKNEKSSHINATIRADNRSGLAYYTKMGFTDRTVRKAVPLQDGTCIDRISKQFKL